MASAGHLLQMDAVQFLSVALLGYLVFRFTRLLLFSKRHIRLRSAAVLVLGDIGRSPRMMYHAESLAENNFETYIIGNEGKLALCCPLGHLS